MAPAARASSHTAQSRPRTAELASHSPRACGKPRSPPPRRALERSSRLHVPGEGLPRGGGG
eukprot:139901-Alexandrium_andersonii.AAC.1